MKNSNNQPRDSFYKTLMYSSIILTALIVSSQFFSFKRQSKIETDRIENQQHYQLNGINFLETSLKKLTLGQFDPGLLFQFNPDNNLLRPIFIQFSSSNSLNNVRVTNKLKSFIVKSSIDWYDINYISAWIPVNKALAGHDLSYQNLIKNDLGPFVTESNGNVRVNCCPKSYPTCRENNVIEKDTK